LKTYKLFILVLLLSVISFLFLFFLKNQPAIAGGETRDANPESVQPELVVQEIIYKPNAALKLERHERVLRIFEFDGKKNTWIAEDKIAGDKTKVSDKSLDFKNKSQQEPLLLSELREWNQKHPVDLAKFYFLRKATYIGWEGKKEVRIYSSLKPNSRLHPESEQWSKRTPDLKLLKTLIQEFKKQYPTLPYSWKDSDLRVRGSYKSSQGKWLIALAMDMKKTALIKNFDGIVGESEFSDHWFAIVNGELKFLGLDLTPLLAADFLNNGQTEWLMAYAGYNREGYMLWDSDFNKKSQLIYSFH
jgi:hypothetical protein